MTAINKELDISDASANRSGTVSYNINSIYDATLYVSGSTQFVKNSERSKRLFETGFTSINSQEVAKRFFNGREELFTKGVETSSTITRLRDEITALEDQDGDNAEQIDELTVELNALIQNENSLVSLTGEGTINTVLFDNTLALDEEDNPINLADNTAFNPDFPVNSISYLYNRDDFALNNKSSDGIYKNTKAPNVKIDTINTFEDSERNYIAPLRGDGGFGNNSTEGTIAEGRLDSLAILNRYTPDPE